MNRSIAAGFILLTLAGCLTPEERAARRAEREAKRAERAAAKKERAEQEAEQEARDRAARDERDRQAAAENAKRAELERTVNIETVCQAIAESHSKHCGGKAAKVYLWCLGSQAPSATASINWGQTQKCSADVAKADCAVLAAGVLPAACGQTAPAAQETSSQPTQQKDPGGISVAKACGPLMEQHCNKCDSGNMKSCVDQSLAWCYNGRPGTMGTGMTADQFATCSSAYRALRCDAAGTGYVPMDCPGLR